MTITKVLFVIYTLSTVFLSGHCCLDPKEPVDKCTQCNGTQVLIESRCFQKIRGCLEYKTNDKIKAFCTACQNGYVIKGEKCQRAGVVAAASGVPIANLTQPAPLAPDNAGNLTKANITMPHDPTTPGNMTTEPPAPKPPKVIPPFPQIKVISNVSDQNSSNRKVQIPPELQRTIVAQFPYLANFQPVQVGPYQLLFSSNSDRSWVMYEQGTILLVQKNRNAQGSKMPVTANIRSAGSVSPSPQYTITHLSQNRMTQQKYRGIRSQIIDKYGQLVGTSLSINYEIKLKSSGSRIILNIDLFTGKIRSISHNQCAKQTYDMINRVYQSTLRSKYDLSTLLKYAYSQFLQRVVVVNVPDKVESVQAYRSDNSSLILFKVVYPPAQADVPPEMREHALIRYNVDKNMTDVQGYFIENVNILDYFKDTNQTASNTTSNTTGNTTSNTTGNTTGNSMGNSMGNGPNATTSGASTTVTPATASTTAAPTTNAGTTTTVGTVGSTTANPPAPAINNTSTASSTTTTTTHAVTNSQTTTSGQVPSAITIPKITQSAPTQAKPNPTQTLNLSQVTGAKPVLGSITTKNQTDQPSSSTNYTTSTSSSATSTTEQKIQKSLASIIKNDEDLLVFLKKKQQFFEKTANGFKILQILNQTNQMKPELNYKIKIITTNGIFDIHVNQNLRNNELRESYFLDNSDSCTDYKDESMISKFDNYLKKSYPVLLTFNKLTPQFKLEQAGQKYLFVYSNEQMKRIVVEINKNKDSTKYIVSKSEVFGNGYCFDKKEMENINFKLVDVSDQCIANNNPAKILKSILNELLTRYKSYIYNSTVVAALTNVTHAKVYISNNFATFEFSRKIQENPTVPVKGDFVLLEQKQGWDILPLGFKKQLFVGSNHPDFELCKKIQDSLMKKYRTYFGGGSPQILTQKRVGQQVYQYAFKTVLGFFSLVATPLTSGSVNLSPLKKISQCQQIKILPTCKSNQFFDANDRKCYSKINGCYKQIGNICIMCESGLILQGGSKECRKTCKWS